VGGNSEQLRDDDERVDKIGVLKNSAEKHLQPNLTPIKILKKVNKVHSGPSEAYAIADDLDMERDEEDYRQQTATSTIMTKQTIGIGGGSRQLPALSFKEIDKKKTKQNMLMNEFENETDDTEVVNENTSNQNMFTTIIIMSIMIMMT